MSSFTITTAINGSSLPRFGAVTGLAWSRTTTVATVTQTAHGMSTGDLFNVTVTSDALAIVTGIVTITFLTANTFTFTCLNGGGATGTLSANHIDRYFINGGYLTVDTHTRYGFGSNTSAAVGDIIMSATLGGTIEFNSTLIRLISFNTGATTVPALDTIITQGSASGKLLGVYVNLSSAPVTAGSVMPVSGFILIRQWNSVSYGTGILTGISATATGADRPGWLEIVGNDLLTATVNRLNIFKVRGDYYDFLGVTTDGTTATAYQIPTNGALLYTAGVEVETAVGSGIYEFYPCAGSITALASNIATDSIRGKFSWIGTTGLIRFGSDGTNSGGGYVPPAGCKLRIPNIFFRNCAQVAPTLNSLPNVTLTSRYEFSTAGGGVIDIDKASLNWYCNFNQPYSVGLTNTNTFSQIVLSECASPIAWTNVAVGQEAANSQTALIMNLDFAGGTMTKCTWTRSAQATSLYVSTWTDCSNFTINGEKLQSLVKAAITSAGTILKTRISKCSWTNTTIGAGRLSLVGCTDLLYTGTIYYDHPATTTAATIPFHVWDLNTSPSYRIKMDGLSFGGLVLCQPYGGILSINSVGCQDLTLRNLGTAAVPLDCGGTYVSAGTWTRATTVMTVTANNHGLKVGDIFAAQSVSDSLPKVATNSSSTLWTVATVTSTSVFTVTVANAGAASGNISYYPTMTGNLITGINGGAFINIRAQRCYIIHTRGQIASTFDNSSKNITFENVWLNDWSTQTAPILNVKLKGVLTNVSLVAQTAVYGTHFVDYYNTGVPDQLTAVAWSRATTVATVTVTGSHNLKTGDLIVVSVSSDITAIILGTKTITAISNNVFTFTCLNIGALSGTISLQPNNGYVSLLMNEPTSDTVTQVSLTNGSAFTSTGGLYMPNINQTADFTAATNIRGHSAFPISEVTMFGGTLTNYNIFYSLNNGTSYSNLYYSVTGGGGASASTTVTAGATTGIAVNDYVWGTNIAPLARVISVTNATTFVVDKANIGTVSGILRFNQLPNEIVANTATGFSLKVRINTGIVNTTAISSLLIPTISSVTSRTATYPLDTNTVTFTGPPPGTDLFVLAAGTTNVIFSLDSANIFKYIYEGAQLVDIGFIKQGYVPQYIRNLSLSEIDSSIPVAMTLDRNYI